ncbi:MAG: hypothetical protein P9X26_09245 [Candidatus Stygibacter frigidus]|nr:hypothetical protein [Candidatus Stygibacter frigidus]
MAKHLCKIVILCFLAVFISITVYADTAVNEHRAGIVDILKEIRNIQQVDTNAAIIPDEVSDEYLVKLGKVIVAHIYSDTLEQDKLEKNLASEGAEQQQGMYKLSGYRYMESGFDLGVNKEMLDSWIQGKGAVIVDDFNTDDKEDDDYHVAYGEVLIIIALFIIIILIYIYNKIKKKEDNF